MEPIRNSLLEVVSQVRPGTRVEAATVGKAVLIGFHHDAGVVWLAFDHPLPGEHAEEVLGLLANRLILCENCQGAALSSGCLCCHHEYREMAKRLREFLGTDGYKRFLAHAPIQIGRDAI